MNQMVRANNSILFEIEDIGGRKYIKKKDKEASKKAGQAVYEWAPLSELLSDKEIIKLRALEKCK